MGKFFLIAIMVGVLSGCSDTAPVRAVLRSATLSQIKSADGPLIGVTGYSALADSRKAGAQAAREAAAQLGDVPAKLVLVFDRGVADSVQMCQGVSSVFDPSIIMGCSSYGPVSPWGEKTAVGVLVVGGQVDVRVVLVPVKGDYHATGRAIGQALKPAVSDAGAGQLLLLFGKCHVPENDRVVSGIKQVLGDDRFPIIGGAAANGEWVYYQGRVYKEGNIGVLLTGDFLCDFVSKKGSGPEGVARTAREAGQAMVVANSPDPAIIFAFSCGSRRDALTPDMGEEYTALREALAGVPIFGFYGSGEIGPSHTGGESRGVGLELIVCALRANPMPSGQ